MNWENAKVTRVLCELNGHFEQGVLGRQSLTLDLINKE
jgi:hypothetical protein